MTAVALRVQLRHTRPRLGPEWKEDARMSQPLTKATPPENGTLPRDAALPTGDAVPFDQESWDRWRARGRRADAALGRRLRVVSVVAAIVAAAILALWLL